MTGIPPIDGISTIKHFAPGINDSTSTKDIFSSRDFVRGFVPPDYSNERLNLIRGFVYSFTSKTGGGKTAIALRLAAHTALGSTLDGRKVAQGNVLMLAGENPDDVRMRWLALSEQIGFDVSTMPVAFRPGPCRIEDTFPKLERYANSVGGLTLVIADTSAAFFAGDDENSNVEAGNHARTLRKLSTLPGSPTVLIPCHPTKNARDDELLPRGGGAFLAEVDGNLTAKNIDGTVEVHWQGKFRGANFEPLMFQLVSVESDQLVTATGRRIPTVFAKCMSNQEQADATVYADAELQRLLRIMTDHPRASMAKLAEEAGWITAAGGPYKSKVSRLLTKLKAAKLADKILDKWSLTSKGLQVATEDKTP